MPQDYSELLGMELIPLDFLTMDQEQTKEWITRAGLYLGAMKYTSDEMRHSVGDLSGGQQAKLLITKMNLDRANVLILDEPTRNFSPLSAPEVRSVLKAFRGTIISVSHVGNESQLLSTVLEGKADAAVGILIMDKESVSGISTITRKRSIWTGKSMSLQDYRIMLSQR